MKVHQTTWCNQYAKYVVLLLCGLTFSVAAQQFDQSYLAWKAKQQSIDTKLAQQTTPSAKLSANNFKTNSASNSTKIRLNSASAQELMQLDGVGEKKAHAIIEQRMKMGGFQRIEDIQQVKGIGPALFAKNKDRLAL